MKQRPLTYSRQCCIRVVSCATNNDENAAAGSIGLESPKYFVLAVAYVYIQLATSVGSRHAARYSPHLVCVMFMYYNVSM